MTILDKISEINIKDKKYYCKVFSEIIKQIKENNFEFEEGIFERDKYYLINENNRKNSKVVSIVPKEVFKLFKELQVKAPNDFLGYTVLINDIRITGFGIPCNLLAKSL